MPVNSRLIGVNTNCHRLAGAHVSQLYFLEVGVDPNVVRHESEEALAGLDVGPLLHRATRDAAITRGGDAGERKIEFGLAKVRFGLLDLGGGGLDVRLIRIQLGLGGFDLTTGDVDVGGSGSGFGFDEVQFALGNGLGLDFFVARAVGVSVGGIGLGGVEVGLLLFDFGLIDTQLGLGLFNATFGGGEIGAGAGDAGFVVVGFVFDKRIAGFDALIVGDKQMDYLPGDARATNVTYPSMKASSVVCRGRRFSCNSKRRRQRGRQRSRTR